MCFFVLYLLFFVIWIGQIYLQSLGLSFTHFLLNKWFSFLFIAIFFHPWFFYKKGHLKKLIPFSISLLLLLDLVFLWLVSRYFR